jgi:lipoic acid synthetase
LPEPSGQSRVALVAARSLAILNQTVGSTKPEWLKVRAPQGERYLDVKRTLQGLELSTVCEHARCPNVGECWGCGTATVMLLGHVCTRGCRFCAVAAGNPGGLVDAREPERVAEAIARLGLDYVVLTMVDRDDLADGGAAHVARTVTVLRERRPGLLVETLTGDFGGREEHLDRVLDAGPDVFGHNLEVTRAMTRRVRDRRCSYDRSLAVLARARRRLGGGLVKSSLMVGIGEADDEVYESLAVYGGSGSMSSPWGSTSARRPVTRRWRASSPRSSSRASAASGRSWGSPTWRAGRWCGRATTPPRPTRGRSSAGGGRPLESPSDERATPGQGRPPGPVSAPRRDRLAGPRRVRYDATERWVRERSWAQT